MGYCPYICVHCGEIKDNGWGGVPGLGRNELSNRGRFSVAIHTVLKWGRANLKYYDVEKDGYFDETEQEVISPSVCYKCLGDNEYCRDTYKDRREALPRGQNSEYKLLERYIEHVELHRWRDGEDYYDHIERLREYDRLHANDYVSEYENNDDDDEYDRLYNANNYNFAYENDDDDGNDRNEDDEDNEDEDDEDEEDEDEEDDED